MLEDAYAETFETGATFPEAASRMNSLHGDEIILLPLVVVLGTLCQPCGMKCFAEYLSYLYSKFLFTVPLRKSVKIQNNVSVRYPHNRFLI